MLKMSRISRCRTEMNLFGWGTRNRFFRFLWVELIVSGRQSTQELVGWESIFFWSVGVNLACCSEQQRHRIISFRGSFIFVVGGRWQMAEARRARWRARKKTTLKLSKCSVESSFLLLQNYGKANLQSDGRNDMT